MKQYTKRIVTVLALAGSLSAADSLHAQAITGTPYLSNMDPSTLNTPPNALYAGWTGATFSSSLTGLNVISTATYGSLYYVIPAANVVTLDPNDTLATLTFTVNGDPSAFIWVGTPFILNDNSGASSYGGYSGYGNGGNPPGVTWNGNVVTETVPLSPTQIAAIQLGNDAIYSFNLQFDPAVLAAGSYDITFNSLVLSAVPEPASMTLAGLGLAALLISRRRR